MEEYAFALDEEEVSTLPPPASGVFYVATKAACEKYSNRPDLLEYEELN